MSHPADDLDQHEFDVIASFAAFQLQHIGFTYCTLSPGDGTKYEFMIVRPPMISQWDRYLKLRCRDGSDARCEFNNEHHYWVASSHGRMHPWSGHTVDWSYAWEKWCLSDGPTAPWTARVIARVLTALAAAIDAHAEDEL